VSDRLTETEAAEELRMALPRLQRIRRAGMIAYERDGRFYYYTAAFIADYRRRITCQPNDSNSETTGSRNAPTRTHGAEHGSTRKAARLEGLRLAQTILSEQRLRLPNGTSSTPT
jgi:hypothetical protein